MKTRYKIMIFADILVFLVIIIDVSLKVKYIENQQAKYGKHITVDDDGNTCASSQIKIVGNYLRCDYSKPIIDFNP